MVLLTVLEITTHKKVRRRTIIILVCLATLIAYAADFDDHIKHYAELLDLEEVIGEFKAHEPPTRESSSQPIERQRDERPTRHPYYNLDCRPGWHKATNVDTMIKFSCLREDESFELHCPEISEKANGVCLVIWYRNRAPSSKLVTHYKEGEQTSDLPVYEELIEKYPYYMKTLSEDEWNGFSNQRKKAINIEAWREYVTSRRGGPRYRHPLSLSDAIKMRRGHKSAK